jgi:hypothetical protein
VLLESEPITIVDIAELISVTANTYSVPEGQDVLFTILTRNVPDGAFIAYVAESITGNITANDLTIGNVSALAGGFSEIYDNIATFTVFANVDNTLGDVGEKFRISARAGNTNGLILGYSDNVTIKDTSEFFSITSDKTTVDFNTNVTFTIQTFDIADGANLFYFTQGDITNFDTGNAQANTGYVITSSNTATVVLRPIAPINNIKPFNLLIRDANTNILLASSSGVNSVGEETIFNNITGGTETVIGNYKYHVFSSSGTFNINKVGETYPEVQICAIGAGQPGSFYQGGGGGEVIDTTYSMPQSIRFNQGPVTVAQTSPTGTNSPATSISFGAGGITINARSASTFISGTGFSHQGPGQAPVSHGGGGTLSAGTVTTGSADGLNIFAGNGGQSKVIDWLSGPIGTQVAGPLGTSGNFGGGGGGGANGGTLQQHNGGYSPFGAGRGGSATYFLRYHTYYDGNQTSSQTYNFHSISGGTPGSNFGFGGGGGAGGRQTQPGPSNEPVSSFLNPFGLAPGGSGRPGAVIMRYRIAED